MRTPSLRRRVLGGGITVLLLVIIALEAFVFFNLREQLEASLQEVLDARVRVAEEVVGDVAADELAPQLSALGIYAILRTPDGVEVDVLPVVPRFGPGPPGSPSAVGPYISEVVPLPDGGELEVLATRAGVEETMRRILMLMTIGTLAAVVIGGLLLRRVIATAIAPLSEIGAAAHRTARGRTGERLRPDDPSTELGRLAAAYDQMLDSLEDALDRARDGEERTRRFLDDAAHQLRTPIAGIRASVETLLATSDPVQRDRLMANLVRETARSSRVLRDLLTMARLDTGRPPTRRPTDLAALCGDEVERTRSLAPDLDVTCATPAHDVIAEVEPAAIQEAVANLLDNARRHARTRIEVRLIDQSHACRLEIADDGPGIDDEASVLIFERFATLDGKGGSGLGLPIARSIAEAHGGTLAYEDGSFVLTLPCADVPAPADRDSFTTSSPPRPGA